MPLGGGIQLPPPAARSACVDRMSTKASQAKRHHHPRVVIDRVFMVRAIRLTAFFVRVYISAKAGFKRQAETPVCPKRIARIHAKRKGTDTFISVVFAVCQG